MKELDQVPSRDCPRKVRINSNRVLMEAMSQDQGMGFNPEPITFVPEECTGAEGCEGPVSKQRELPIIGIKLPLQVKVCPLEERSLQG